MVLDPHLFEEGQSQQVFTAPRVTTSLAEPQELPPLPPEPSTAQRIGAFLQNRLAPAFGDIAAGMRGESAANFPSNVMRRQQLEESTTQTNAGLAILNHIQGMVDKGATPEQLRALKPFYNHALQSAGMPDASPLIDSFIENPSNIGDFLKLYPVLQGRLTQQQLLQLRRDKTGTVLPRLLADVKPLAGEEALKQLDTALRTWTTQEQDVTTLNENALRGFFPNLEYAKPDRVDQTLAQYGITPGSVALSAAKEAAVEAERVKRPTPSDRDAALLVTGRNIKSFDELSAAERADVLLYKDAPKDLQVEINSLKKASPEKSITDLYDQARQNVFTEKEKLAKVQGTARAAAFAQTRGAAVYDTKTGTTPMISWAELNKANQEEPGRYLAAAPAVKALNQQALIEDVRGGINRVRDALKDVGPFDTATRAQISFALRERDPRSAISSFLTSSAAKLLSPPQEQLIVDLAVLSELSMAMRSVLSLGGQASDMLRSAMMQVVPNAGTLKISLANKQLDAFEALLNRQARGIPNVPLQPSKEQPSPSAVINAERDPVTGKLKLVPVK